MVSALLVGVPNQKCVNFVSRLVWKGESFIIPTFIL